MRPSVKLAKAWIDQFDEHLGALRAFQLRLMQNLQLSGQTAFYVAYEDIQNVDVVNGLAKFLGQSEQLNNLSKKLKK